MGGAASIASAVAASASSALKHHSHHSSTSSASTSLSPSLAASLSHTPVTHTSPLTASLAHLKDFVAIVPITRAQVWDAILNTTYTVPVTKAESMAVFHAIHPFCSSLAENNVWSRNFTSLVELYVESMHMLQSLKMLDSKSKPLLRRTGNAALILRYCTQHFLSTMHLRAFLTQFEHKDDVMDYLLHHFEQGPLLPTEADITFASPLLSRRSSETLRPVMAETASGELDGDISRALLATDPFHAHAAHTRHHSQPDLVHHAPHHHTNRRINVAGSPIPAVRPLSLQYLDALVSMTCLPLTGGTIALVVEGLCGLLVLFSLQLRHAAPARNPFIDHLVMDKVKSLQLMEALFDLMTCEIPEPESEESIVQDILGIFYLPFQAASSILHSSEDKGESAQSLEGSAKLLAPLLLACMLLHTPVSHGGATSCLALLASLAPLKKEVLGKSSHIHGTTLFVNVEGLHGFIVSRIAHPASSVLMYLLMMHAPDAVVDALLAMPGTLESMVLPLLEVLYHPETADVDYITTMCVNLMEMFRGPALVANLFKTNVAEPTWFKERIITDVSVGDLTLLVLLRIVHHNLKSSRSAFLHHVVMGLLINLGEHVENLHSYTCQRIIKLYDTLYRQYLKQYDHATVREKNSTDSALYEVGEALMRSLQLIHVVLSHRIVHNPHFAYTLLVEQDGFMKLDAHPRFSAPIHNIKLAIRHLNDRLLVMSNAAAGDKPDDAGHMNMSPERVLAMINTVLQQWPADLVSSPPCVKYEFEERQQIGEYLVPFVWRILVKESLLFRDEGYALFQAM